MPEISIDFETRGVVDLRTAGVHKYALDASTSVLCAAFAAAEDPPELWTPDMPCPEPISRAVSEGWTLHAFNANFELTVWHHILAPRYGWPEPKLDQWRCTMAMACASALPGGLDAAAAALGLAVAKDANGHRLMMQMARPRKPRKGEDPRVVHWHDDSDRRERLAEYCKRDVEIERALFRTLPPLSADEQRLWQLDAQINKRGFHVDLQLALATRKIVRQEQEAIDAEITELTGGRITSVNQVAKLGALLDVTSLTKKSVSALLADKPEGDIKRLLELRQQGAQAAARKLDSLISGLDIDQRLRGTFRIYGASTGRWSGTRFQPQNLKKAKAENLDTAITAIMAGDLVRVRQFGAPLAIAGDVSRHMICAAEGHVLIGADFSAIESRVLAWISGEKWKLNAYAQFDKTGDPKLEPYCVTASKILKREVTQDDEAGRAIGKTCDLAFGYGGGLGAWRRFDSSATYTDAQIETFKAKWRTTHGATVRFWHGLEDCLRRAVRTGKPANFSNLAAEIVAGNLCLSLPSGRKLTYPKARLEPGRFDTDQIIFRDNGRGGWSEIRGWYGTFTENVVQAVARDLLAAAMMRLDAAGYQIVLHVHDEAVAEVADGFGSVEHFLQLMTELPDWATGLPIAAKGWTRACYAKSQTPSCEDKALNRVGSPPVRLIAAPATQVPAKIDAPALPALIGQPLTNGKICCPFHADDTPSLQFYGDHFHCFGCGAHGDLVDWLMITEGKNRAEAEHILSEAPSAPPPRQINNAGTLQFAWQLWEKARPIVDTPAIRYLADVRGIDVDILPDSIHETLRFHPRCPFGPGAHVPCLIALFRDVVTDEPAGVHRIALTNDVFAGGKVQRWMLGQWHAPRAIKLWPATDRLFLGEGIETVLAAATRVEHFGELMQPAWAAGSAGNISKFPILTGVRRLILLVDHEDVGKSSTAACRLTWRAAGRKVVRLEPDRIGADFNDLTAERRTS